MKHLTWLACISLLLVLAGPAPWASAGDEPPEAFPPPAPAPAGTPAGTPARSESAASWSAPAGTPAGSNVAQPTSGGLPPPQVVRRGSSTRPATASHAGDPYTPSQPIVRDVPVPTRRAPHVEPPAPPAPQASTTGFFPAPTAPEPRLPAAPPSPPAATQPAPLAPAPSFQGGTGARVLAVDKAHNVTLPDSTLALRLDVAYELTEQAGRDVYVAAWFARAVDGGLIDTALPAYTDPSGRVTVQTRAARVEVASARYVAALAVPYAAFPVRDDTESYDVEARVFVLRSEAGGRVSVLARGSTTFRVYGYVGDAPPER